MKLSASVPPFRGDHLASDRQVEPLTSIEKPLPARLLLCPRTAASTLRCIWSLRICVNVGGFFAMVSPVKNVALAEPRIGRFHKRDAFLLRRSDMRADRLRSRMRLDRMTASIAGLCFRATGKPTFGVTRLFHDYLLPRP